MNVILAAAILSLSVITLNGMSVMGVKEEPEENMLTRRLTANGLRGPVVKDILAAIDPDELHPLCSNFATTYDRLLKRGPTFNAWGGKKRAFRASTLRQFGKKNNPPSQFNPWGGKRSEVDDYALNSDDRIPAPNV